MMQLTHKQEQVLLGGMLGDMCIFKDKNARYHRMNFAHSLNQSEYFFLKYEILKEIFKSKATVRFWTDKRTDKEYREIRVQSATDKYFSELYEIWYKEGKRTVSDSICKLDWFGLAIWFMDDGFKSSHGGLYFSTDRYSDDDMQKLINLLSNNFNVIANKQGNKIYVPKRYAEIIKNEIAKFTPKTMRYKLIS